MGFSVGNGAREKGDISLGEVGRTGCFDLSAVLPLGAVGAGCCFAILKMGARRSPGRGGVLRGAGWHLESHAGGRDLLRAFQLLSSVGPVGPDHCQTVTVLRRTRFARQPPICDCNFSRSGWLWRRRSRISRKRRNFTARRTCWKAQLPRNSPRSKKLARERESGQKADSHLGERGRFDWEGVSLSASLRTTTNPRESRY